jgi:cytochrome c5
MKCVALSLAFICIVGLTPAAQAANDLTLGKQLYIDNCQRCHGATAGGGLGLKLRGDAADWSFARSQRAVMTGYNDENKKMRAVCRFGERQGLPNPTV